MGTREAEEDFIIVEDVFDDDDQGGNFQLYSLLGDSSERVQHLIDNIEPAGASSIRGKLLIRENRIKDASQVVCQDTVANDCNALIAEDSMGERFSESHKRLLAGDKACVLGITYGDRIDMSTAFDVDLYVEELSSIKVGQKCTLVSLDGKNTGETTVSQVTAEEFFIGRGETIISVPKNLKALTMFPFWVFPESIGVFSKRDVNSGDIALLSSAAYDTLEANVANLRNMAEAVSVFPQLFSICDTLDQIRKVFLQNFSDRTFDLRPCSFDFDYSDVFDADNPTSRLTPSVPQTSFISTEYNVTEFDDDEPLSYDVPDFSAGLDGTAIGLDGFSHHVQTRNADVWLDRSWAAAACVGASLTSETLDVTHIALTRTVSEEVGPRSQLPFDFVQAIPLDVDPANRLTNLSDIVDADSYADLFLRVTTEVGWDMEETDEAENIDLSSFLVSRVSDASLSPSESKLFFSGLQQVNRRILLALKHVSGYLVKDGYIDQEGHDKIFDVAAFFASVTRYSRPVTTKYISGIRSARDAIMSTCRENNITDIVDGGDILETASNDSKTKKIIAFFRERVETSSKEWKELVFDIALSLMVATASLLMGTDDARAIAIVEKIRRIKNIKTVELARKQIVEEKGAMIQRYRRSVRPERVETDVAASSVFVVTTKPMVATRRVTRDVSDVRLQVVDFAHNEKDGEELSDTIRHTVSQVIQAPQFEKEDPVPVAEMEDERSFGLLLGVLEQMTARFGYPDRSTQSKYFKYVVSGDASPVVMRKVLRKVMLVEIPRLLHLNGHDQETRDMSRSCVSSVRLSDKYDDDSKAIVILFTGLARSICVDEDCEGGLTNARKREVIAFAFVRMVELFEVEARDYATIKDVVTQDVGKYRASRIQALFEMDNADVTLYEQLTHLGGLSSSKAIEHVRSKSIQDLSSSHAVSSEGDDTARLGLVDFEKLDANFFGT